MASNKLDNIKTIHDEDIDVKCRRIYMFDMIDNESAKKAVQNIHFLDNTDGEIHIYFNTPGGNWDDGIAIYNAINACKNQVIGHVIGTCSSMGSIILQACDQRLMFARTTMLIHPGMAGHESVIHDFLSRAAWEARVLSLMFDLYYDKIKATKGDGAISLKKLKEMFSRDKYIFAEEAIELGLVDKLDNNDQK